VDFVVYCDMYVHGDVHVLCTGKEEGDFGEEEIFQPGRVVLEGVGPIIKEKGYILLYIYIIIYIGILFDWYLTHMRSDLRNLGVVGIVSKRTSRWRWNGVNRSLCEFLINMNARFYLFEIGAKSG